MTDLAPLLRRKLAPARPSRPGAAPLDAVLRKTMPRVADDVLSLDVSVESIGSARRDKAEVIAALHETDLVYAFIDGEGATGLAVLDRGLLAALIEVQMSGRVSRTAPAERIPTRTDGIVAGEIVDQWLGSAGAVAMEAGLTDLWPCAGYRRDGRTFGRREADLALEPVWFQTLEIGLSLGGGAKTGRLSFAVPVARPAQAEPRTVAAGIRAHLPDFHAPLRVVLMRRPIPVAEAEALAEGDIVDVPVGCLRQVRLESLDGRLITTGRLGQLNGRKAVRLAVAAGEEGDAPEMPPHHDLAAPTAAGLPDLPAPDGLADLPGLPPLDTAGLPDLPNLPDLPELPDLPSG